MAHPMENFRRMKRWVCFRFDESGHKEPVSAVDGYRVGSDEKYAHRWVTWEAAMTAAEKNGWAGVALSIPDGFVFIDVDRRKIDHPVVQRFTKLLNTLAERSLSGEGAHFYGTCDLSRIPFKVNKDGEVTWDTDTYRMKYGKPPIEVYVGGLTRRFAIVTALRKQKNSEKFTRLYDRGDIMGYSTESEADAALTELVMFRTGDDRELLRNVLRGSALWDEKWEREDYQDLTFGKAERWLDGKYHWSVQGHPDFIVFSKKGVPSVSPALLAKSVRENVTYILVRDSAKHGLLKYVYENGCYRLYSNDMMMGVIKRIIAEYDESLIKIGQVSETLQHINTDLEYVTQDMLDADESIINFENTLIRVTADSIEILPHSPDVLSTVQIPCRWTGIEKPTPYYDQYLATLTNNDKASEKFLLEILGVILSSIKCYRMKKALFHVGPGDTGKSIQKALAERLIGKGNFIGIDLKEIEARFGTGVIFGTRLAGSSDMSYLSIDELKVFKRLTGGDSVFAEFKGQQGFEYTYNGFLWFCMNQLPRFGGDNGEWVYDRIMILESKNVIPKDKQDKELLDKLYEECEGIIYKAVKALQQVIRNGYRFTEPDCVIKAREAYMKENNTILGFMSECMTGRGAGTPNDGCTTGRIYDAYRAWCRSNNNGYAKTAREFREAIAAQTGKDKAKIIVHTNHGNYYRDYTLTDDAKQEYLGGYHADDLF